MITRTTAKTAKMNTAAMAAKAKASEDVVVENKVDEVAALNDNNDNTTSVVSTLIEPPVVNELTTDLDEDNDILKKHYITPEEKARETLPLFAFNVSQ